MEIVNINEIEPGDVILITGMGENEYCIVTVESVTDDGEIIPVEMGGLDYTPEDMDEIVRFGKDRSKISISDLT